ncbi:hypothetical protein [Actinoallomurus rhizosphaericola]|uniref:hypothetical protein n=1 Tax=Actinoallomurus rhizosphaericola TaxID=2952536 RepID=UPI002091DB57|nr:hypothetical protein [Actinoallomurus rhizosphaericola]MCO5993010.1 hypothetical protein [Actinoallomurus rhizosphaericola]
MTVDALAVLTRRFPGVVIWFGAATRSWWAMVWISGRWRLVEAMDPEELTKAILSAATWPYPAAVWTRPVVVTAG